ncbi:MAG: DUF3226 domain-containing protein [Candidatus Kapaibacteriota bacterium]
MIDTSKIFILVEGIDDAVFLRDVLRHWFQVEMKVYEHQKGHSAKDIPATAQILALRGKDKISKLGALALRPIIDARQITSVLVLFDADYPDNDTKKQHKNRGGVKDRTLYIQEQAKAVSIEIQGIFLFPFGDKNGDLEVLLEQLVTKPQITQAWDVYEETIKPDARILESEEQTLLSKKSKIFSYSEALTSFENAGGRERKYLNTNHWNLDPTSQHLQPLHAFLKPHFDSTPISPTP